MIDSYNWSKGSALDDNKVGVLRVHFTDDSDTEVTDLQDRARQHNYVFRVMQVAGRNGLTVAVIGIDLHDIRQVLP